MWSWRVKMPTQNLLRLLLLLMLMMRIVLATVCCRFGSWGLVIKLSFCSDFEHKVWSRFWSWKSGEILNVKFGQYFAADVWLRLRSWILVKIMKLGLVKILSLSLEEMLIFGWDFKVNAWSIFRNWSLIKIGDVNLTLGSVVPLAMFISRGRGRWETPKSKTQCLKKNTSINFFGAKSANEEGMGVTHLVVLVSLEDVHVNCILGLSWISTITKFKPWGIPQQMNFL